MKSVVSILETTATGEFALFHYYVAPIFHTTESLKEYYFNSEIEKNSAHFPIEKFPSSDDFHSLKYQDGIPKGTYGVL